MVFFKKLLHRLIFSVIAGVLLLLVHPGCTEASSNSGATDSSPPDRLRVVVSFSILEDWVRQVGGKEVEVDSFVGREGDPHTYQSHPRDLLRLRRADLIFGIGFEFENWLKPLHRSSESGAPLIFLAEKFPHELLIPADAHSHDHDEHGNCLHSGEYDPHFWMDVSLTKKAIDLIRDALIESRPETAEIFRANAENYRQELEILERDINRRIALIHPGQRKLVTGHDVFQYFARRYRFEVVGSALGSATTETFDPRPRDINRLVQSMKQTGVQVVFPEAGMNQRYVAQLAEEAGVRLAPPLYTDYLGTLDSPAATYLDLIRHNVEVMVQALQTPSP